MSFVNTQEWNSKTGSHGKIGRRHMFETTFVPAWDVATRHAFDCSKRKRKSRRNFFGVHIELGSDWVLRLSVGFRRNFSELVQKRDCFLGARRHHLWWSRRSGHTAKFLKKIHKIQCSTLQKCGFVFRYTALCRHVLASPLPTSAFNRGKYILPENPSKWGKTFPRHLLLQSINAESALKLTLRCRQEMGYTDYCHLWYQKIALCFFGKYNKRMTQREILVKSQIISGLNRKYVAENKGGNLSCGEIFAHSF